MSASPPARGEVLRFLAAGTVAVLLDAALFYVLTALSDIAPLVANTAAFLLGMTAEYGLSRTWVFRHREQRPVRDYVLFLVASSACLLASDAAVAVGLACGLHVLVAKGMAIVLVTAADYWVKRTFVFPRS